MCWLPDVRFPGQHLWPLYQMCLNVFFPRCACSGLGTMWQGWTSALPGLACHRFVTTLVQSRQCWRRLWCGGMWCWSAAGIFWHTIRVFQFHVDFRQIPEPAFLEGLRQLVDLEQGWVGIFLLSASFQQFVTDIQNIYENIISIPCDLKNDFKTLTYFRCLLSQTLPSTSGPPWLVCPVIMAQYSVVNIVRRMHTSPPRTDKPPSYTCFVLVGTEACFGVRPSSSALFFILLSPVQFLHI